MSKAQVTSYTAMVRRLVKGGYPVARAVLEVTRAYGLSLGQMERLYDAAPRA